MSVATIYSAVMLPPVEVQPFQVKYGVRSGKAPGDGMNA